MLISQRLSNQARTHGDYHLYGMLITDLINYENQCIKKEKELEEYKALIKAAYIMIKALQADLYDTKEDLRYADACLEHGIRRLNK